MLKALFIQHFCPQSFSYVVKRLNKRAKVNFKIYDFTN